MDTTLSRDLTQTRVRCQCLEFNSEPKHPPRSIGEGREGKGFPPLTLTSLVAQCLSEWPPLQLLSQRYRATRTEVPRWLERALQSVRLACQKPPPPGQGEPTGGQWAWHSATSMDRAKPGQKVTYLSLPRSPCPVPRLCFASQRRSGPAHCIVKRGWGGGGREQKKVSKDREQEATRDEQGSNKSTCNVEEP